MVLPLLVIPPVLITIGIIIATVTILVIVLVFIVPLFTKKPAQSPANNAPPSTPIQPPTTTPIPPPPTTDDFGKSSISQSEVKNTLSISNGYIRRDGIFDNRHWVLLKDVPLSKNITITSPYKMAPVVIVKVLVYDLLNNKFIGRSGCNAEYIEGISSPLPAKYNGKFQLSFNLREFILDTFSKDILSFDGCSEDRLKYLRGLVAYSYYPPNLRPSRPNFILYPFRGVWKSGTSYQLITEANPDGSRFSLYLTDGNVYKAEIKNMQPNLSPVLLKKVDNSPGNELYPEYAIMEDEKNCRIRFDGQLQSMLDNNPNGLRLNDIPGLLPQKCDGNLKFTIIWSTVVLE